MAHAASVAAAAVHFNAGPVRQSPPLVTDGRTMPMGAIISPPVLGAAAFLIAEYLKIGYLEVLRMAAVPTVLYYASLLFMVELDQRRIGAAGKETEAVRTEGAGALAGRDLPALLFRRDGDRLLGRFRVNGRPPQPGAPFADPCRAEDGGPSPPREMAEPTGRPRLVHQSTAMYCVSRYSWIPSAPPSRPRPLSLTPPKGSSGLSARTQLT